MNFTCFRIGRRGFTGWDGLVVALFVVLLVAGLVLPALFTNRNRRVQSGRISCVNNLKQVGLAMRMWSNDHGERFPQVVTTNDGGSLEFIAAGELVGHYLAVSNELVSPKILTCPEDKNRSRVADWAQMGELNLSYFVGLDADDGSPQSLLSGDRDVVGGGAGLRRGWTSPEAVDARWAGLLHRAGGNIGLGDGSVSQVTDQALTNQIHAALRSGTNQVRFQLPGGRRAR